MEIVIGKTAGFCYGVKRAVDGAPKDGAKTKESIYCLGEIVHNRQVIEKLESLGIKCVETIQEAQGTVLIRAHGVPKEIYHLAKEQNIKLQDYTCPNVLKVQNVAEEYREKGYFIFLLGSKKHPENIATLSHCGENYFIFEEEDDVEEALAIFQKSNSKKLLLISQTTFSLEKFYSIEKRIQKTIKEDICFVVKNTICKATELRQKETEELSKKVDTMIVIGGKNSSNTRKLYEIAKKHCNNTILIENVKELKGIEGAEKIGIMAGASTPKESIEEVVKFLDRMNDLS